MNEQAAAWLSAVEGLPAVHERLRRVVIECDHAFRVIPREDGPGTLFYVDPPYMAETRTAPQVYRHEMHPGDHEELLAVLRFGVKGKVMISGYRCKLYDTILGDWNRHDFELPNNAASGESKRRMTECLWCNFGLSEGP